MGFTVGVKAELPVVSFNGQIIPPLLYAHWISMRMGFTMGVQSLIFYCVT